MASRSGSCQLVGWKYHNGLYNWSVGICFVEWNKPRYVFYTDILLYVDSDLSSIIWWQEFYIWVPWYEEKPFQGSFPHPTVHKTATQFGPRQSQWRSQINADVVRCHDWSIALKFDSEDDKFAIWSSILVMIWTSLFSRAASRPSLLSTCETIYRMNLAQYHPYPCSQFPWKGGTGTVPVFNMTDKKHWSIRSNFLY
jgi:hypothetical protein